MNATIEGEPLESIDFLPGVIKEALKSSGIRYLKNVQVKGIKEGLEGHNLLVTSPTGSGKTLIGEVLAVFKSSFENAKTLYLVPYKALAEEVKETLSKRYPFVRIGIATGDYRELPNEILGKHYDLLVVTYEKADSILRDSPRWLKQLSLLIVDEIHLIGDFERGPILDIVLTRALKREIQIVGLSATIPNPEDISNWLNAKLIINKIRPVKLLEGVYSRKDNKIYFFDPDPQRVEEIYVREQIDESELDDMLKRFEEQSQGKRTVKSLQVQRIRKIVRNFGTDAFSRKIEMMFESKIGKGKIVVDNVYRSPLSGSFLMLSIIDMVYDLLKKSSELRQNWQILIFRKSRKLAQSTAKKIVQMMKKTGLNELFPKSKEVAKNLYNSVEEVTPLTEELAEYMKYGVAFHHAGLSKDERKAVEEAFRSRKIGVIVATPTLAAGINLPARRVVIEHSMYSSSYWEGENQISVASYKQRSGRAGRPGLDSVGESILIARNKQELIELFDKYIFGEMENVDSKLGLNLPVLREQILALMVSEKKADEESIISFFEKTFFYHSVKKEASNQRLFKRNIKRSLEDLERWGFIEKIDDHFYPTKIGVAVSKLYLDPLTATIILGMLGRIHTEADVHPVAVFNDITRTPDMSYFRLKATSLIRKAELIISKVPKKYLSTIYEEFGEDVVDFLRYYASAKYRFQFSAEEEIELASLILTILLILWIESVPIKEIVGELTPTFGSGDFIEFVRTSERLLFSSRELAKVIGKNKRIIEAFDILRRRVEHGVTEELLELTKIPSVGRARAKILYQNGYTSIEKLAKANVNVLSSLPTIGETTARKIIEYARNREKLK